MPKAAKIAWGIDIGSCTLKAVKIGQSGDGVELLDFAVIEHEKILSQPEVTPDEKNRIIGDSLRKFFAEHDTYKIPVAVSMPGNVSFARFIKLPPVETKRIPEIVKFEAIQQIPFNIDDVEWDWQKFTTPDNPDIEVGIFAIKSDLVQKTLDPLNLPKCEVANVQMAPMALYNFLRFDQKKLQDPAAKEAFIVLDIGAENTDLIIASSSRVWQRSIAIGGNKFTEAVQKAFKLSFAKAEGIKRTANSSKYARQIFQAMRPVFADLAGEIQRSVGFYTSSNRDVKFREVIALGNAMKLPGLTKFLQQSLSLSVKQLDSFDALRMSPDVSASQFAENLPSFGVAYGLAVQMVGFGPIQSNLLPREFLRKSQWKRKRKWFVAAVAVFMLSPLLALFQTYAQKADLSQTETAVSAMGAVVQEVNNRDSEKNKAISEVKASKEKAKQVFETLQYRDILPRLLREIRQCLPNHENVTDTAQVEMLKAYAEGIKEGVLAIPRKERQQICITRAQIIYTEDLTYDFTQVINNWASRKKIVKAEEAQPGVGMEGMMGMPGMGMPGMGMPGMGMPGMGMGMGMPGQPKKTTVERKKDLISGFVVVLEGYTPNKGTREFLFPPKVGIDRQKWGFFHRLQYLGLSDDTILKQKKQRWEAERKAEAEENKDTKTPTATNVTYVEDVVPDNEAQKRASQEAAQLPFETYIDPEDEKLWTYFDTSEAHWIISGAANQPAGLGVTQLQEVLSLDATGNKTTVTFPACADPLTGEIMSQSYEVDKNGQVIIENGQGKPINNDFWFRVKFKVKLKNPPKPKTNT